MADVNTSTSSSKNDEESFVLEGEIISYVDSDKPFGYHNNLDDIPLYTLAYSSSSESVCSDVEQDNVDHPNIDNQIASLSPIEDNLASSDEEDLLAAQPAKRRKTV